RQIFLTEIHIVLNVLTTKPFTAVQPCDNAEPICCPLVTNHCLVIAHATPNAEVKAVHSAPGLLFIKVLHPFLRLFQKSLPFWANHPPIEPPVCLIQLHKSAPA